MTAHRAGSALPLRAFGASDVGRRRTTNEDRFHVDPVRGIFMVVDGVGGHAAGDKAADIAIAAMTERLERQTGPVTDRLREAIIIANNAIHRLAASHPAWRGMACVATAAVVQGERAAVGHVGDSRLYRLFGGAIEKITPDHSPVGAREDAREMSEFEAMRHPRRNEVYRDIGSEARATSDPDFVFVTEIDLPPGAALLLCSDGLTDLVSSDTLRQIAGAHAGSPADVVAALIHAANDAGGKDNITAVYVERPGEISGVVANAGAAPPAARPSAAWPIVISVTVGLLLAGSFWLGVVAAGLGWMMPGASGTVLPGSRHMVVRAGESIMAAVLVAPPGTTVTVDPGEYRERVHLREGVRVISRVPRGATIRLPADANESDVAVVASGVSDAELNGFRLVGDAQTPLGVGVMTREAAVRLVDLDITGAATAAVDIGPAGDVSLSGSYVHDNPGAALVVRAGATPRIANSVFAQNGAADLLSPPVVVEPGAEPVWRQNVFDRLTSDAVAGLDPAARTALSRHNWFVAPSAAPARAVRRGAPVP